MTDKSSLISEAFNNLMTDARSLGLTKVYLHATDDGINIYNKAGFKVSSWPVLEMTL